MWVVKIGGSLASSPELPSWLAAVTTPGKVRIVVAPGGGPFADIVRRAQAQAGFDDAAAHRMAILATEQFGLMLCGMAPGLVPASSAAAIAAAHERDQVPVWMADAMTREDSAPAASWDVTSDSLAAWLAARIGAKALVLAKSAEPPENAAALSTADLAQGGIIDPAFPATVRDAAFAVRWLGPRGHMALAAALTNVTPNAALPGLKVVTGSRAERR